MSRLTTISDAAAPVMPPAMRSRERGFTLIELVYATGYFMFGMTGIMLFQLAAANGSAKAGDLMMATTLTANQLESMRNTPTATLIGQGDQTFYYNRQGVVTAPPGYFVVASTVTAPTSAIMYSDASVTTTWRQSGINVFAHGVTMATRLGTN